MSTYELVLRSEFSATHRLNMHDGRHEPLHKHKWRVEVFLQGRKLDANGMVADFTLLQRNLREIVSRLNGTYLNELPAFSASNPSAELIARHLHDRYKPTLAPEVRLMKVRVWETDDCAAAYLPPDIQTEEVD